MRTKILVAVGLAVAGVAGFARPIRPLNGLCNSMPLKGDVSEKRLERMKALYRALEIPETRFHDVVSENAGIELVDFKMEVGRASDGSIIVSHVLPNVVTPVVVTFCKSFFMPFFPSFIPGINSF